MKSPNTLLKRYTELNSTSFKDFDEKRRIALLEDVTNFFILVRDRHELLVNNQPDIAEAFNIFRMISDRCQFEIYVAGWDADDNLYTLQSTINKSAIKLLKKCNEYEAYVDSGGMRVITDEIRPVDKIQLLLRTVRFPLEARDGFLNLCEQSITLLAAILGVRWHESAVGAPEWKYQLDESTMAHMEKNIKEAASKIRKLAKQDSRKLTASNLLLRFSNLLGKRDL